MTSAVRRVPPDWIHPKDECGQYVPLEDGAKYDQRVRDWDEAAAKWQLGLKPSYDAAEWAPIEADLKGMTYADYAGNRPDPNRYMPQWSASQCTHWQMYQEVTEGRPISPIFSTPEELAWWMANHEPDACADTTANYYLWLSEILQKPLGSTMFAPADFTLPPSVIRL